jgi:hypothetical protein
MMGNLTQRCCAVPGAHCARLGTVFNLDGMGVIDAAWDHGQLVLTEADARPGRVLGLRGGRGRPRVAGTGSCMTSPRSAARCGSVAQADPVDD